MALTSITSWSKTDGAGGTRKYAPGDTVLEGLEREAREAKKGLWADPVPLPPCLDRKARQGQGVISERHELSTVRGILDSTNDPRESKGPPVSGKDRWGLS